MKSVQKIDLGLTGYDELFMNDAERKENKLPRIYDIPLSEIDDFPDHPFKVKLDEDMDQLVQSIKERGIITPVTLRPKEDGRYEIVSGHRRKKACELAGFDTVKAEVREMTRDEAKKLLEYYGDKPVRYSDRFLTYIDAADPPKLLEHLECCIDSNLINTFCDSRKVYCVPTAINKGTAVTKFKKQFETGVTVGVGDSMNDLSMLESVDIPIIPRSMACYVSNPNKIVVAKSEVLSDAACDEISKLIKSDIGSC